MIQVGLTSGGGWDVDSTGSGGVYVHGAGNPGATTPSAAKNGFEVACAISDKPVVLNLRQTQV